VPSFLRRQESSDPIEQIDPCFRRDDGFFKVITIILINWLALLNEYYQKKHPLQHWAQSQKDWK
jgi:hypothetical protein